jgi:hypothetical protein
MRAKSARMNVSSIGIQLVQSGTATGQRTTGTETRGEVSHERVTATAPPKSSLPAGVGEKVDKTA